MVLPYQKAPTMVYGSRRRNTTLQLRERKEVLPNGCGKHHKVRLVAFVPLEFFAPFPTSDLPSCPIGRRKQQLLPRGKDGTSHKASCGPEQAHQ